jgi:hypothetical protein
MNRKKYNKFVLIFIPVFLLFLLPLYAQEQKEYDNSDSKEISESDEHDSSSNIFKFKGQFKNLYTQTKTDQYSETGKDKTLIADLTRLRLSPELNLADILLVHVDYDNEMIVGNYLKTSEFNMAWRPSNYNDLFHLSREPYYSEDVFYRMKLHRAYAKLTLGNFTATAGRQQIRFGSGRMWNPLDILNPVDPTNIEGAEEQKGTDAIKLDYYPNEKTEIGVIYAAKRVNDSGKFEDLSTKNSNTIARLKTTFGETEIAGLGGRVAHRSVGGADLSGILFDGTIRGSALYSHPDEGKSFWQASAGYEYNFASGLYFLAEFFYNQNGLNYNEDLSAAYIGQIFFGMNDKYYRELANQPLTYNQHYAGVALGYDVTALLRAELFSMYDFQGQGLMINPSLKYNAFQNIDVAAGAITARIFGNSSKTSDFEVYAENALFYASLTWYF